MVNDNLEATAQALYQELFVDNPDISVRIGPVSVHVECKRVERLALASALRQIEEISQESMAKITGGLGGLGGGFPF